MGGAKMMVLMASREKVMEDKLIKLGKQLSKLPSSVDQLLRFLDQVESCLSMVDQAPSKSMQNALTAFLKALVADEFLRHTDMDVKVAVASCIMEISRITAPDAPYDDEQLKEIFQLIVAVFGETSNRSYAKWVSVLETMAKVRLFLVMLDLNCDALIGEMFQNFLMAIRDFHHESVLIFMETIMSQTLEECEDIPPEILSPLLISVKKENKDVLPIRRNLAEKVLANCTTILKPNLKKTVESIGMSINDFSKIISSICQETSGEVEDNDVNVSEEHPASEKLSVEKLVDERLVGSRYYEGVIQSFNPDKKSHQVDEDVERLNLNEQQSEFVGRNSEPDETPPEVEPLDEKPRSNLRDPPSLTSTTIKGTRHHQSANIESGGLGAKTSDAPSCGEGGESNAQSNLTEVVEGFTVPKKFAALYRSIYQRHGGHIASAKRIKASLMAFEPLVIDLLEVISSMVTMKHSEMNNALLQYWDEKIFLVEALEFNVGWLRERLNVLKDNYTTMNTLKTTLDESERSLTVAQQEFVMALEARESLKAQLVTAEDRLAKAETELRAQKADVDSKVAEKIKFVTIMEQTLLYDLL